MSCTINQLFHTSMYLMYVFTLYRGFMLDLPMLKTRFIKYDPGQLKYLTIWNVIIQAIFFFICMLNDWFGTNAVNPKKPPFIRKLKDYIHAVFSFPIAMFVGVTFWALMFVDRELVFPKVLDAYFPWWLNHLMHTMIMVSIVIETILAPRKYPKRSKSLLGLSLFMITYLVWIHVIYYKSGIWVYPVIDVLSLPLRVAFFASMMLFSMMLYYLGETLDNFVWGNEHTKQQKSYAKSK
ncbi:PREDICTED: androgen-induced gene 1 protein-like isoform X2 [Habropoda laboriosa]|uniref:androgen-induced gene 1 protein-like isoform X2 n=1 Tax=Habropoda laboriosa TaxID=597456 RepID=UPI00083D6692|nr:PREDICTED: androgen-induced gene 1 protein-like isoform X2 [Habropoda laboriosa]